MGLVEHLPRAVRLSRHRSLAENRNGRDFYVGDLHGSRELLEDELAARSFSPERDRVIVVGDLVDRGPESFDTLALVHEPWFYSTLGNHELMWLEALSGDEQARMNVAVNGGEELLMALEREPGEALLGHVAAAVEKMPFALSVQAGGATIGVTHAEPPGDWEDVESLPLPRWQQLVWERGRFVGGDAQRDTVANVDAVVVGHTPGETCRQVANVLCIDTGACMPGGHLTLLETAELLARIR